MHPAGVLPGMKLKLKEERVHLLFQIGVGLKGLDGALETIGGLLLLFTTRTTLDNLVGWLTAGELQEDPRDFVANHLVEFFHHLSINTQHFAAIYLLTYGIAKMGLVAGLLRGKLWSYPAALSILGLFLVYQVYRLSHTHSLGLAVLTLLDVAILALIWREYRYVQSRL